MQVVTYRNRFRTINEKSVFWDLMKKTDSANILECSTLSASERKSS